MNRSRRNRILVLGLILAVSVGLYEARTAFSQREQLAALREAARLRDAEAANLLRELEPAQHDLTTAEQQLAALPRAPVPTGDGAPARMAEMQAWLGRVKRLKQIFANQPSQRIPEMQLLQESDWLTPADHPLETDAQLRMALAQVREAARVRFRPKMSAALRGYEAAAGYRMPASILALAPYFQPPVDRAMIEQYELVSPDSGGPPGLKFQVRAPIDEIYEHRSRWDSHGGGTGGGNPTSWIPNYFEREKNAMRAFARANPLTPTPGLPGLAPYFDPPLPAALVDGYEAFAREATRPR
jgi:hypothetical protein